MLSYKPIFNKYGKLEYIETSLTGQDLLWAPKLNKDFSFPKEERKEFNLLGKIPYAVETLEEQAQRIYQQYGQFTTNLGKNIYLNDLHDKNETLFYRVVRDHIKEMLPIIYTPTMGEVVEKLSLHFRRPRGLYLSYPEQDDLETMLDNRLNPEVDIIVMTDGERILGIGDQGVCGMMIPIAKLMVYCLCAGVNPFRMLPIQLDVGTNNQELLHNPLYYGWKHPRISGKEYDDFIEKVVTTIQKKFPHIFLHWEDFGRENARRNLEKFRSRLCTFNDDIQGTGAVTLAALLAAIRITKTKITEQRIVILGAGSAGVGIADQIYDAMLRSGLTEQEACSRFWLVDREGLLFSDMPNLLPFQRRYARPSEERKNWPEHKNGQINLYEVVTKIKPTILIGTSAQGGAFTKEVIQEMAKGTQRPIIFPLSNPTEKSEATPRDLLEWTDGTALIATGSPFDDVVYKDKKISISQCNNSYVFPGIGLGVIASKAKRLSDDMIWQAAKTLSECSPALTESNGGILPDIDDINTVSKKIACAVAHQARKEGLSQISAELDIDTLIENSAWDPHYAPYRRVERVTA